MDADPLAQAQRSEALRSGPLRPGRARAVARERALLLIADLWDRGLCSDNLPAWRAAELGGALTLPEVVEAAAGDTAAEADFFLQAAATHVRLSQVEIFPYQSVFLDEGGLLGGDQTAAVAAARTRAGLGPPVALPADHISEELRLLAFLSGAQADALRDGVDDRSIRKHQQEFLDQHLLRWLVGLRLAVEGLEPSGQDPSRQDPSRTPALYTVATQLLSQLVLAWRSELAVGERSAWDAAAWSLPELRPGLLEDQKTGLGRIARRLCTPALSGLFLSQTRIRTLGAQDELPAGFGKRWQVLESLLSAAAHYQVVPALLTALDAEVARHRAAYQGMMDAASPALRVAAEPWLDRLSQTDQLVAGLRSGIGAADGSGSGPG